MEWLSWFLWGNGQYDMAIAWLPMALWAGGQALSSWLGGRAAKKAEGMKPEPFEPEPFQPYTVPYDTSAFESKLAEYGKEQRKGVLKSAAARGDYGGPGGVVPGQMSIAGQMTKSLADYEMSMQQQQALQKYQQYYQWAAHNYGEESAEARQAYDNYLKHLQAAWQGAGALGQGWGQFMGNMGNMGGGGQGGMGGDLGGGLGGYGMGDFPPGPPIG